MQDLKAEIKTARNELATAEASLRNVESAHKAAAKAVAVTRKALDKLLAKAAKVNGGAS